MKTNAARSTVAAIGEKQKDGTKAPYGIRKITRLEGDGERSD